MFQNQNMGQWHYTFKLYVHTKYILPQSEHSVLARTPNTQKTEAELSRVWADLGLHSETLSQRNPTSMSPPLDESSSPHGEKERHAEHTQSWINAPGTSLGYVRCSVTKNRFQFPQGSGDRIGNNWSMNFVKPKKNQLDQLPSHQASQPEPPLHKYALPSTQRLP